MILKIIKVILYNMEYHLEELMYFMKDNIKKMKEYVLFPYIILG